MTPSHVHIVGAGLAGLAAANALKTFGIKAEVFEAAPALGEIGAAVNVSPQAFKALQAIGLGDYGRDLGKAPGRWKPRHQGCAPWMGDS